MNNLEVIDGGRKTNPSGITAGGIVWPSVDDAPDAPGADVLPEALANVVDEVATNAMAPRGMVLMSALVTAATAFQHRYTVTAQKALFNITDAPISLWTLTISGSGTGKSTVDKALTSAIRDFDRRHEKAVRVAYGVHQGQLRIWETEKANAKNQNRAEAKQLVSPGASKETKERVAQENEGRVLAEIVADEPVRQLEPSIISSNGSTHQGVVDELLNVWPSGCFMTDEGGGFFGGYNSKKENAREAMSRFNNLWDGQISAQKTKGGGKTPSSDARFSLSIMVQPGLYKKWLQESAGEADDIGFLPRFLFCHVGEHERYIEGNEQAKGVALDAFNKIILEALEDRSTINDGKPREDGTLATYEETKFRCKTLYFNADALKELVNIFNRFEAAKKTERFAGIAPFVSRASAQVVRVAAVFHCIEHGNNAHGKTIPIETLSNAENFVKWCLHQALAAQGINTNDDATDLIKLGRRAVYVSGDVVKDLNITKSQLMQNARGFDRERTAKLLDMGAECGWWEIDLRNNGSRAATIIKLNPLWVKQIKGA